MGLTVNCKYLVAALVLIASAAPLSAQSVRAGIDAWQRSDFAGAVAIWRPLADKGDPDAQFNLGQAYRLGRGVPINLAAAKTWFERAASQGHIDAETTLGLLLFQNGDQPEGLKWLKKAAEQGEPRAMLVYGTALVNGDSVTQDPVLGYAYVSEAAARGLGPAKDTLDQLDKLMSAADRKRGEEMAGKLAKGAPPSKPLNVEAKPVETARAKPQSSTKSPKRAASATPPVEPEPKSPPTAAPAARPQPKPSAAAASGAWRIQLGAFSQKGSAEALYRKLADKPSLQGRHPFYIPVGTITRLQAGPFESKAAAESACRAVGVSCFPVSAK